ncbi:hypothetical protein H4219_004487 [Mycoemilia scoparia]|uniref:Uncharacterized protein n=1 Tax=Mycoemilia scoparia TaxID=417184 RepID=A0A9W7ZXC1_9FUNG|nr:hypothetical protein H4219_004487 [Mycoemilia scoparia]
MTNRNVFAKLTKTDFEKFKASILDGSTEFNKESIMVEMFFLGPSSATAASGDDSRKCYIKPKFANLKANENLGVFQRMLSSGKFTKEIINDTTSTTSTATAEATGGNDGEEHEEGGKKDDAQFVVINGNAAQTLLDVFDDYAYEISFRLSQ